MESDIQYWAQLLQYASFFIHWLCGKKSESRLTAGNGECTVLWLLKHDTTQWRVQTARVGGTHPSRVVQNAAFLLFPPPAPAVVSRLPRPQAYSSSHVPFLNRRKKRDRQHIFFPVPEKRSWKVGKWLSCRRWWSGACVCHTRRPGSSSCGFLFLSRPTYSFPSTFSSTWIHTHIYFWTCKKDQPRLTGAASEYWQIETEEKQPALT